MSGIHPDIYRYFGIEPAEAKMIVMKTGGNFQYFESIMKELIWPDCPGATQGDITKFKWTRAPRPIYPMDKDKMDNWQSKPAIKL